MSGLEDIDRLFRPGIIGSLSLDLPPVSCRIWKKGEEYEEITLKTIYPFDTLDTIKQTISLQFKEDKKFNPQFLFVATQKKDGTFAPLDYTWYPIGSQKAKNILYLPSPMEAMASPVASFVTRGGNRPTNSKSPRGRTMIEELFGLKVPTLYVFPFHRVLRVFEGEQPISNEDWFGRFYPFYPELDQAAPLTVSKEDAAFAKMFMTYLEKRKGYLNTINRIFQGQVPLADLRITGVKQLRLTIQEAAEAFEDCQSLFYARKVTKEIPYMRIIPSEGTPITKVLVGGVLPIPAIDNPEVIAQWAKETTPTMGEDFLMLKYVHRAAMDSLCPIYGTIRIYHDGTSDILIQPPKHIRMLKPATDFQNFGSRLQTLLEGVPIDLTYCEIGEAALVFQLDSPIKFNKQILKKRLNAFAPFFQEIAPMKDVQSILSLRYKMVSQYASENSIFAFLTQYAESKKLEGTQQSAGMITRLQEEFLMSELDATTYIEKWYEKEGILSVKIPEENEFMDASNPGIDIHIFAAHPTYSFHVHRVDSYLTLERLYSLLSVLFMEDEEGLLAGEEDEATFKSLASAIEKKTLKSEKRLEPDEEEEEAARSTVSGSEAAEAATEARIGLRSFRRAEEGEEEEESSSSPEEVKAVVKAPKEKKVKKELTREDINPDGWFLRQLKSDETGDASLFEFKPTIKDKSYAKQCAANEMRMPNVLNKAQFEDMLRVYKKEVDEGTLFFNVYPLKAGQKDKIAGQGGIPSDAKEITISRYGSSKESEKYYFCPELFCLRDKKMILESDFDAEEDREGEPKDEYTCPFCKGTEIMDRKKAQAGATVLRRIAKEKASPPRPHLYIGFVGTKSSKSSHPQELGLPCCHLEKKTLRIIDKQYEKLGWLKLDADRGTYLDVERVTEEDKAVETVTKAREKVKSIKKRVDDAEEAGYRGAIAYEPIFDQINTAYIVDENKDLSPGRIGILPGPFDTYFQQNSSTFVKRTMTQQKLAPKSRGFLRMGVEIGPLTAKCDVEPRPIESLLGVLAPLLHANSINEVRGLLLTAITGPGGVKIFVNANFGNLVNEFYVPSDPDLGIDRDLENMTDTTKIDITPKLRTWAQNNLHVTVTEANHYAVRRIYKSYNRFQVFLRDKTQRKDLRHLTTFLSEASLLGDNNRRGLQIIVLEWSAGQEKVVVKCSPYGFSLEHELENDFVFLWHNGKGVYELIFYAELTPEEKTTILRWKYKNKSKWPRIVQDRVNEYMSQCQSQHTSIFTSQMNIKSESLVPLSMALTTTLSVTYKDVKYDVEPYGIVRDSYNHAVFVLYPVKPVRIGPDSEMVAMPIVDDGFFPKHQQLYLDVQDFTSAPANVVIDYYAKYLTPIFAMYPGYKVKNTVRTGKGPVVGVRLENRIFIHTEDAQEGSDLSAYPDKERKVDEWDINRDLSEPCGSADIKDNTQKRLEELYQYFRYTVANWIATEGGDEVQESIESIVFDRMLPDFEKRKRLEILCGTFARDSDREHGWLGWMQPTTEQWDMPSGLLRKDCRVQEKDQCDGACIWKEKEGVCALHVDEEVSIRSTGDMVNTRQLFTRRVIEELIHFPRRRKELLQNRVSQMSTIVEPIREGDQYIIPEKGMTWLALLRLDWRPQEQEVPLFYEEMATPPEGGLKDDAPVLPEGLQGLIGSKTRYEIWISSEESLAAFLQVSEFRLDDTMIQPYVRRTNTPIGIVDLRGDEPTIRFVKGVGEEPTQALVFVAMEDSVGLLVDKRGRPTVSIAGLDGMLLERWRMAEKVVSTTVKKGLRLIAPAVTVKKAAESVAETVVAPSVRTVIPTSVAAKTVVVEEPKKKKGLRVKFANSVKKGSLSVVKEETVAPAPKEEEAVASIAPPQASIAPKEEKAVASIAPPQASIASASASAAAPVVDLPEVEASRPQAEELAMPPPVGEVVLASAAALSQDAPVQSKGASKPPSASAAAHLPLQEDAPVASVQSKGASKPPSASAAVPQDAPVASVQSKGASKLPSASASAAVPPPIAAAAPKPASLAGPTLSASSKKASVAPPAIVSAPKKASVAPPAIVSAPKKVSIAPPAIVSAPKRASAAASKKPSAVLRRASVSSSNNSNSSNEAKEFSTSSNSGEATETTEEEGSTNSTES
jgi:hypothetical protein